MKVFLEYEKKVSKALAEIGKLLVSSHSSGIPITIGINQKGDSIHIEYHTKRHKVIT